MLAAAPAVAGAQAAPHPVPDSAPQRFTIAADGFPLAVFCRTPAAAPTGAILLVHGRTWSSIPDFDLQVPGEQKSVLAKFAARGWTACAVDLRGYGSTPRDSTGWDTPDRSARDVAAVLAWLAQRPHGARLPVLLGWSNGALVAQLAAQRFPARMSALVLYGYPWDATTPFIADQPGSQPLYQRNTPADATSDFITPGSISRAAIIAYESTAMTTDPVLADWHRADEFNALDPARLTVPVLMVQGEGDPSITGGQLERIFHRIRSRPKQLVILHGGDHAALLEETKPEFVEAVVKFLGGRR